MGSRCDGCCVTLGCGQAPEDNSECEGDSEGTRFRQNYPQRQSSGYKKDVVTKWYTQWDSGARNSLTLGPSAGYVELSSFQKFPKLYNYDLSTFLYVCWTSRKILFKEQVSDTPTTSALCRTHNIYCTQLTLLHGTAHQSLCILSHLVLKNRLLS